MSNLADVWLAEDREEALSWSRQASDLGYAPAMFNLAGLLVKEDPGQAIPLLEAPPSKITPTRLST